MKAAFAIAVAVMKFTLVAVLTSLALLASGTNAASAQDSVLQQMVGTWRVEQRLWSGPNVEPISAAPTVARRRLISEAFLEEVMEVTGNEGFTRIAYFNYNSVTQRYESVSMDTRAPQMMYETSYDDGPPVAGRRTLKFQLEDPFVVPRWWGSTVNAGFKSRKVLEVERDRQVMRLYWTPLIGENAREFLAVEYVYTRQR